MNKAELDTIRRTIANDCNDSEFDLFIQMAARAGLDPFRRQIFPVIYSKNDAKKRKMTIMYSRDGLRCIAARCGDYRPASEPAEIVYDEDLKDETNPKGIVQCTVRLWKQDNTGEWFPVAGQAFWDEYAPITEEWHWGDKKGERIKTGKMVLDDSGLWRKMPVAMITKCATSDALRAGWPEQFSGMYGEGELDKSILEDRASELAEAGRIERIEQSIGAKNSIAVNFGEGIEFVKVGQYYDRWQEKMRDASPAMIETLREQNVQSLRHFWAMDADAALELKKQFEANKKELNND